MNRRTLVLPALIGLLAPLLAACGGNGTGSAGKAIVVGTTDEVTASTLAPAPLDPAYAYDAASWNVLRQTVQTLMAMPRSGLPVPEAARQCAFTDTGNERYVCTLRSGLAFADGTPVTARDVKYSIDRVLHIRADDGVSGLLSNIDTVETQGDDTVVFHLRTPDATFPYKLATPTTGIVEPSHYPKDRLRTGFAVDASGPYQLKAQVEQGAMVGARFIANPHYSGMLTPKSDEIDLRTFPQDPDAMGRALDKGDIDLMTRTMSPQQVQKYEDHPGGDVTLVESDALDIGFLGFNTDAAPVKDKAVRTAMAQVVDRGALVSSVYAGTAQPLYSLVPAAVAGHTNAFFNDYGNPSVSKARATLEHAGIHIPVKLTLNYSSDHFGPVAEKEFRTLQSQFNASGLFDVDIKGTPWNTFRFEQLKGHYAVYGLSWVPDFPDADNFIAPFLSRDNFIASTYINGTIRNDLIPESRRETNRVNAMKSLTRIQDIVADDVPVLPLWQGKEYVAAHDDIEGVEWSLDVSSALRLWELSRGVGD